MGQCGNADGMGIGDDDDEVLMMDIQVRRARHTHARTITYIPRDIDRCHRSSRPWQQLTPRIRFRRGMSMLNVSSGGRAGRGTACWRLHGRAGKTDGLEWVVRTNRQARWLPATKINLTRDGARVGVRGTPDAIEEREGRRWLNSDAGQPVDGG